MGDPVQPLPPDPVWAVKEGLDCHLVLEERVKGTYRTEASGNNFLYQLMGVKSIDVVEGGTDMMAAMEKKSGRTV